MVPASRSRLEAAGRLLGALAAPSAGVAAGYLLFPRPLADAFFAAWVAGGVGVALAGGVAAWTARTPLVWAAAVALTALSIAGMWSIGPFVAPAALLLVGSALLLQASGPREDVRAAIVEDPPTVPEAVLKTLAGAVSMAVGGSLVYLGAVGEGLFGASSRETLACAIGVARWDAVAVTVIGLAAAGLGGWLLWKQVYAARVLAAHNAG